MAEKDIEVIQQEIHDQIKRLQTNFQKTSSSRYSTSYLETRKDCLEEYWAEFVNNHREFLKDGQISKKEKDKIKELYNQTEDMYLEFKTILKEHVASAQQYSPTQNVTVSTPQASSSHTKLPPINIPTFSGNYQEWMSFKDLFLSMIHNDSSLSNIHKHHYLRSSLSGEAEQLVRQLDVTDANYMPAWNALVNRYSNTRVIVNNILNRLLQQKKLTSECHKGLKELLDTTNQCLSYLKGLSINTESWDPVIVHLVVSKLDSETHKGWEQSLGSSIELPTYAQLTTYLEGRFRAMEMVQSATRSAPKTYQAPTTTQRPKQVKAFTTEVNTECSYCNKNHYICHCTEFSHLDVDQRKEFVKNNNLCFNCLVKGHSIKNCRQSTSCRTCNRKHHTLLHYPNIIAKPLIAETEPAETTHNEPTQITSMKVSVSDHQVILATAQIGVKDKRDSLIHLRALVDQGSQATFITESAVQLLNLKKTPLTANVTGIGNKAVKARHIVQLNIYSPVDSHYVMQVNAHVLSKLTPLLPTKEFEITHWPTLSQVKLADPHMHLPGPIDVLLGADVYACILLEGLHKHDSLIAQNSRLGWLVSGTTNSAVETSSHNISVSTTLVEVDQLLRKFWETEEYQPHEKPMSQQDQKCEEHYKRTHTRQEDGRYVVRLPFQEGHEENLGDSRIIALHRLRHMEKRFLHKPDFKKEYTKFIDQYQELHHMEDVDPLEQPDHKVYYLPHHAIIRESSATTKLRVVFDGTVQPSDGSALNDELLIGPPLQQDLRDLIIRWRTHKICLIADVKQMYRQILVAKEDVDYQRILWRTSPEDPIVEKRLLTVTYGTSCAPFLAIRTLKQLAQDEKSDYPDLVDVINNDFYMDDLLTGANDEEGAVQLQRRIVEVMAKGKFEMHKWASNSPEVLKGFPSTERTTKESVDITMDDTIKALGIKWNSLHDVFELKLEISDPPERPSKTSVLSDIARSFDPLGFLAPVIITAKVFLQKLWVCGVNWTDELPLELSSEWSNYRDQLYHMPTLYLKRWVHTDLDGIERVEVHGFSDASNLAYAAVVYLRVVTAHGIYVSIVIAKSKVAPVKQVSVPRLELCGAVLLSKLLKDVQQSLQIPDESVYAWTDSMIVLAWLRRSPNTWKTYVANRTTEIINNVSSSRWHHIKSADNPADVATRGVRPDLMKGCELWWLGPKMLHERVDFNDSQSSSVDLPAAMLEAKEKKQTSTNIATFTSSMSKDEDDKLTYLNRYSTLSKLVRVTAYLIRFVKSCKVRIETKRNQSPSEFFPQHLTVAELRYASNICIRLSQEVWFHAELQMLKKGQALPKSSGLVSLTPFIDDHGIIRVTGRLRNASVNFETKSPILLVAKCHLAWLIANHAHVHCLHGGPQLTLSLLRLKYWIIGARNLSKKVVGRCIPCFKQSAAPINQLMGQLPACRVTPAKPFRKSGVDYAGPVTLKLYSGRCNRTSKAYIALFVCTVTKAIHLELVSDLSTAAFLAAFRRFTARRGHCSDLWSDCATNFVGASKELDVMFKNRKSETVGEISEILANENTNWHCIPPSSLHFGGLWEAGVRSVKGHLKRVIGQTLLTFEEYATLLSQVESCVNSRPLSPISGSVEDLSPLTPGHFLIGEAPITVPEESLESIAVSRLDRWQMIQKMLQSLWLRWSTVYLTTLQNRYKWTSRVPDPEIGTVVLVKDERLPPGKWLLGRIIDRHPGRDGLTRVVTLKLKNSTFRRPIAKICPLPLDP